MTNWNIVIQNMNIVLRDQLFLVWFFAVCNVYFGLKKEFNFKGGLTRK